MKISILIISLLMTGFSTRNKFVDITSRNLANYACYKVLKGEPKLVGQCSLTVHESTKGIE